MNVEQLIEYLRSWVPSGELMGDSLEGLGGELGGLMSWTASNAVAQLVSASR